MRSHHHGGSQPLIRLCERSDSAKRRSRPAVHGVGEIAEIRPQVALRPETDRVRGAFEECFEKNVCGGRPAVVEGLSTDPGTVRD